MALNVAYIRDKLGIEDEIEVRSMSFDPAIAAVFDSLVSELEHVIPAPQPAMPPAGPTTVVQRVGSARLAPAMAMVMGELR
jgi:hypothetical protein